MGLPADIAALQHAGDTVAVARVSAFTGFGGRRHGEALAVSSGGSRVGGLLGGAADAELAAAFDGVLAGGPAVDVEVRLGDPEAVAAGLACGGRARITVAPAAEVPGWFWEPQPHLVVVGAADLAHSLKAQAALLGWRCTLEDGAAAALASSLGPTDAVVVLSHDPDVDVPTLAAALADSDCYVGALGSRSTQARRRTRLAEQGFSDEQIGRIHGPVGLDIGARIPEETALAICAEIVAHRSGRTPGSLKDSSGPING